MAVRLQFSFRADYKTQLLIFTQAAKAGINMVTVDTRKRRVIAVAGPPGNNDDARNAQFRAILSTFNTPWTEAYVIQIFNLQSTPGTPGAYRIAAGTLTCACIDILASYTGEPAPGYAPSKLFQVPACDFERALAALQSQNLAAPILCVQ